MSDKAREEAKREFLEWYRTEDDADRLSEFRVDLAEQIFDKLYVAESQRTQAPSETLTKLLKIAARVARREYVPSLENCRTISDARAEVRRMDDLHAQLAWELKTVLDALAGTQSQAAQWTHEQLRQLAFDFYNQESCKAFAGKKNADVVEIMAKFVESLPFVAPVAALEGKETNET